MKAGSPALGREYSLTCPDPLLIGCIPDCSCLLDSERVVRVRFKKKTKTESFVKVCNRMGGCLGP